MKIFLLRHPFQHLTLCSTIKYVNKGLQKLSQLWMKPLTKSLTYVGHLYSDIYSVDFFSSFESKHNQYLSWDDSYLKFRFQTCETILDELLLFQLQPKTELEITTSPPMTILV